MATAFDRDQLLVAFDEIGEAAISAHARLDIAVFGGSALMLTSNFRFATEDVDIAEIGRPWPDWLSNVVEGIAARNGWSEDWLNEAVISFEPACKPRP
jgi:predicted proteasome-type protease